MKSILFATVAVLSLAAAPAFARVDSTDRVTTSGIATAPGVTLAESGEGYESHYTPGAKVAESGEGYESHYTPGAKVA